MREVVTFFKALADEARLKMLWLLMNHRELCVCDFMEVLEITQSKASRHLRNLYHAGLVNDRREGLWVYYTLRPVDDELVLSHMETLRRSLSMRNDADALLERLARWFARKATQGDQAGCAPT